MTNAAQNADGVVVKVLAAEVDRVYAVCKREIVLQQHRRQEMLLLITQ